MLKKSPLDVGTYLMRINLIVVVGSVGYFILQF